MHILHKYGHWLLIAGINAHICEVCVEQANDIIQEELYGNRPNDLEEEGTSAVKTDYAFNDILTPRQLKSHPDQWRNDQGGI